MARTPALLSAVVALLTLGACGAPSASAGSNVRTPVCGPAAGRSLAMSSSSRVYVVGGRTVYGCTRGSAPRRLGITGPCLGPGAIGAVAVAAREVAMVARRCGVDTGSSTVEVVRLTDGHTVSSHPAATVSAPESFTTVSGLVLAADGTAAWIGEVHSIVRHTAITGVYAAPAGPKAAVRTLDSGPAVAGGSLRLSGRTVSWRHGAASRHAQL